MAGFSSLDAMFADLALTVTRHPTTLSEAQKAEIIAGYADRIRRENGLSRTRVDEYYAPARAAELHGVKIPESFDEVKLPSAMLTDGTRYQCRIAHFPFQRGGVRAAYFGKLKKEGATEWVDVVVKEFIYPGDRTVNEYKNQSENSAVAKYLMGEYCKSHRLRKPMRVVPSRVLKMRKPDGSEVLYNTEEFLPGTFDKWTNNAGAILKKDTDLLNFTTWSNDRTGGYLMVSDLQGVEDGVGIALTDPAILCKDKKRFGPTNFSDAQMIMCLEAARHGVGVSKTGGGGHTLRAGFSLYSPGPTTYPAASHRIADTAPTIRIEEAPVPLGYVACSECGTVRSARMASLKWQGSGGERCSKCNSGSTGAWLRNLTKEKVSATLTELLLRNAKNDMEATSSRSCGHSCCAASSYNSFGTADTMFIQMLGGGLPRQRYSDKKCCTCTGYSAPCTKCTATQIFLTGYFLGSGANPHVTKRVVAEVFADFSFP